MAPSNSIQPFSGPRADAALEQALDDFGAETLRTDIDANHFLHKCRSDFDAEVRGNRAENLITETLEIVGAGTAGALATWRTSSGFPIGQLLNHAIGAGAKATSIGLEVKLPKFEDMCERPTMGRRALRTIARSGKVLFHSQLAMLARDMIEDDQ